MINSREDLKKFLEDKSFKKFLFCVEKNPLLPLSRSIFENLNIKKEIIFFLKKI